MSYELFEKAVAINSEFDVIPSKTSVLAKGIVIDKNGYMKYKDKTYLPNMVKLNDLPTEIKSLFIKNNIQAVEETKQIVKANQDVKAIIEVKEKKNDGLSKLNSILFEQLQNIIDPEDGTDLNQELKKANAICNIADKIINIEDLSLKAEIFHDKKASRELY